MVNRACNPSQIEPNLSLNLDISEAINNKKGQFPRIVATEIVKLVNSRTPQTSILALALLDICVKNCGYPFYLQISRKDFLNQLVRKFPERPPFQYGRAMTIILEQIQFWKETICKTSRNREDFGYIRDMYRLLEYKGYIFPEFNPEDGYVLNDDENAIRTASEIEQEERDAQQAKLQELIRRGTPRDLQEANRLMGVLTGYKKNDQDEDNYRAEAAKDLERLKRKADLLDEMMKNVQQGHPVSTDEVYVEIVSSLRSARPKIERMVGEESEDHEGTQRLLALNDYITSLLEKYDLLQKGDFNGATGVSIAIPPGTTSSAAGQDTSSQAVMESLIDIDDDSGDGQAQTQAQEQSTSGGGGAGGSENLIDSLDGLSIGGIALQSGNSGSTPVNHSPSPLSQSQTLPSQPPQQSQGLIDEWDVFTSAPTTTQSQSQPTKIVPVLSEGVLKIDFEVTFTDPNQVLVKASYKNQSPIKKITNLKVQLAVTKSYKLEMGVLTGDSILPNGQVSQTMTITPNKPGLKIRYKVGYNADGSEIGENGVVENVV